MAWDIATHILNYKSYVNELVQLCEVAEAQIITIALDLGSGNLG